MSVLLSGFNSQPEFLHTQDASHANEVLLRASDSVWQAVLVVR